MASHTIKCGNSEREKLEMLTTISLSAESEQNTKKVASCETVIVQVLLKYL
jgi:hypothetical protein